MGDKWEKAIAGHVAVLNAELPSTATEEQVRIGLILARMTSTVGAPWILSQPSLT